MSDLEQLIRTLVEQALREEGVAPAAGPGTSAKVSGAASGVSSADPSGGPQAGSPGGSAASGEGGAPARPRPRRNDEGRTWRPRRPLERQAPRHLGGLVREKTEETRPASPYDASQHERSWTVGVDRPRNRPFFDRIVASTPSRIGTGRAGTRYRTETYLELRADHAVAKDAVYADLPPSLAGELGCIEVVSRCPDREHYLLHPNDGRRLSDESRAVLERDGTRGADVQVIVADGLAAPALMLQGARLLPAIQGALAARGLGTGRPILAHMARVGLQDDVGVLLGSRATLIVVGERPGLGTGDSLSIYLAVAPAIDQDNADKNCISNIRPAGLSPERAADMAADLVARGLAIGKSGLVLSSGHGA